MVGQAAVNGNERVKRLERLKGEGGEERERAKDRLAPSVIPETDDGDDSGGGVAR